MLTHHVQGTRNRRHSTSSNVQKCSCQIYRCTSLCHLPNGSSRSRNQGEYDESSHRAFFFLMSVVRPSFSTLVSFSSQWKRSSLKSVGMAEKHRYRKLFSLRIAKVRISLKKAEVDSARDSSGNRLAWAVSFDGCPIYSNVFILKVQFVQATNCSVSNVIVITGQLLCKILPRQDGYFLCSPSCRLLPPLFADIRRCARSRRFLSPTAEKLALILIRAFSLRVWETCRSFGVCIRWT